ncbi:hypothetical protein [Rhodanobacter denitrificans]|nr:hypothetical protein [Rhodanobacter denitrificans]UJJ53056.1 hypothetical protein LRK52_18290 [Rhodanobacter denitrificans]
MSQQQNSQATPTEYRFGAEVFSMDTVSYPDRAAKWVRMCSQTPALADRFVDVFLAAQLTMLAHGLQPEFH